MLEGKAAIYSLGEIRTDKAGGVRVMPFGDKPGSDKRAAEGVCLEDME